jgi:hydrogenase expression/formation protein HypE
MDASGRRKGFDDFAFFVIPAKAGIHGGARQDLADESGICRGMDSRFRGNDGEKMTLHRKGPPIDFLHGRVDLTHGGGGRAMAQLVEELFVAAFDNDMLRQANDQASFTVEAGRMVMSTDGYVISPLFFPGGDIGSLAVHGTINDVAMAGAVPLALSASYIIEEGLPLADLRRIVFSMAKASREAGVPIVTGDTKVVEKGKGDGLFISTTGIGRVPPGLDISGDKARPGDAILISGTMGDHGIAVMSLRESLGFETTLASDSAALHGLVAAMVAMVPEIHCLRDPTRGGLASTLNELASQSGVGMMIQESAIPLRPEVVGACELLGLDPLYVANEGKLIAIVPGEAAERLLAVMRAHPLGENSAIIGRVIADDHHFVQMETSFGGKRVVDWLAGEQLPRIC